MTEPISNSTIQLNISQADFENLLYCIRVARQSPMTDDNGIDVLTYLRQKLMVQQRTQPTIEQAVSEEKGESLK